MKILHVLETSVPSLAGYTIRAKYIVENQKRSGMEPVVITSPFFKGGPSGTGKEEIGGITYYRTNHIRRPEEGQNRLASYMTRLRMIQEYKRALIEVVEAERPDIIHAHSSYTNGLAANHASRRTGIPYVYEMRSLWGESAVVEDGLRSGSLKHSLIWSLELKAVRAAARVVAISRGIKDEVVGRGIDEGKIDIMPNGVDTSIFAPRERNKVLAGRLGLDGLRTIGYIGSLRRLEGLDLLIRAFEGVRQGNPSVRLLIIGEGPEKAGLEGLASALGLDRGVVFTGEVPHSEILDYYSILDVLVFPRIDAKINQAVTPLKPLEAMSMGRVCIGSDVGGLRELITDGYNGLVFEAGNAPLLAEKILSVLSDDGLYERLRRNAIEWVKRERDWGVLIPGYLDIYARATRQGVSG